MAKWIRTAVIAAVVLITIGGVIFIVIPRKQIRSFEQTDEAFYNPLMGYAPGADDKNYLPDSSLVYMDITWRELEPEDGVYDWTAIAEENYLEHWREQGKHVVLRFLCDKPSSEAHMDIPDWLYEKTGDGSFYDMAYGKGYSPDYSNEEFIRYHSRAVAAMGEYLGQDTFISYVQLGSLGHWGEWHVNYDAGIKRLPGADVRDQYITPYLSAFPNAKILMRRPFRAAATYGFGVYNDMAGHPEDTQEWLQWLAEGGDFSQAREENALSPMPEVWKTAPVGGEFTSSIPMEEMLGSGLDQTLDLLQDSHTTFLGPKVPTIYDEEVPQQGVEEVLKAMGYRLWISELELSSYYFGKNCKLKLQWQNSGIAPMYWDWPVYLYFLDEDDRIIRKVPVEISLSNLCGGDKLQTVTMLEKSWIDQADRIGVGIEDPLTGRDAVYLCMGAERRGTVSVLYNKEEYAK